LYQTRESTPTFVPKNIVKVSDCLREAFSKLNLRFPLENRLRHRDVRLPLSRIIGGQRLKTELGLCAGHFDDKFGMDGELAGVADIDRAGHIRRGFHHAKNRLDQVVHIAKGARLSPFPLNRDLLPSQSLHDEIGNHASVIRVHPRAISIEDPDDLDRHFMLSAIVKE
jgi:hypothetical protein